MGLLDQIRRGTYAPSGAALVVAGCAQSLAETSVRVAAGEDLLPAVRDFLDQTGRVSVAELAELVRERPQPTGSCEGDALLGGIVEHLAATRGFPCPAWAAEPDRFLERFWFVSAVPGFRAIALAQTPIALKRRGVMWPARSLERV